MSRIWYGQYTTMVNGRNDTVSQNKQQQKQQV